MRTIRIDSVLCRGGEGPLWDVGEQAIYCLDNYGKRMFRHDPATGETRSWDFPLIITALALREAGGAVVALQDGLHLFDFANGALDRVYAMPLPQTFGFNDGKVDRRGRFLVGASTTDQADPQPDGGLFRLDPSHELVQLDDDVHYSNGPAWSPDDRTFYFSDSWRKTIYAYDYDIATGAADGRRVFVTTEALGGVPDGATVDSEGRLWVAIYGGSRIAVFDPAGKLEREIAMPVKYVSSVMFGGPDLEDLYVTTISHNQGSNDEPDAGYLFRIEGVSARGLAEPRYAG